MSIQRSVAHFDLDSFFVSVECKNNSSLIGKPVVVGGGERGVVASASYEARKFGVRSAMPVKLAKRLCPDIIIIKGDMDKYSRESRMVTDIISNHVPMFEKSSIDEFYIDLTGMDKYFGCELFTSELRKTICKETGLSISQGLATNKMVSKVATNESKPNGQIYIPFGNEKRFLAPLPVNKLPMVGEKTGELLRRMGVETIQTLSEIPEPMMVNLLGKNGIELSRRANGIDNSPVVPYQEQKSVSTENTFNNDTINLAFLNNQLIRMCEQVAYELRAGNKLAGCVTIKIRYSDFQTFTKQVTIAYTASDHIIIEAAKELFSRLYDRRLLVRMVGVRVSSLIPGNYQINLFDDTQEMVNLYQSIDSIKRQFGEQLLMRASGINQSGTHTTW
ncbi:DNA polymerase IV [Filimonas lacunae]|uniref:DNA polymerase IV n=1 Tax=Filimonas lacunae TaxID=477680 RepID=UPI001E57B091|nr:DNA polymerase IV [Filimonas lacunae]